MAVSCASALRRVNCEQCGPLKLFLRAGSDPVVAHWRASFAQSCSTRQRWPSARLLRRANGGARCPRRRAWRQRYQPEQRFVRLLEDHANLRRELGLRPAATGCAVIGRNRRSALAKLIADVIVRGAVRPRVNEREHIECELLRPRFQFVRFRIRARGSGHDPFRRRMPMNPLNPTRSLHNLLINLQFAICNLQSAICNLLGYHQRCAQTRETPA